MSYQTTGKSLFVQPFVQVNKREDIKALHYNHFVWKKTPVTDGSPHKGPVICKAFPCHEVIMYYINSVRQLKNETLDDTEYYFQMTHSLI